jgi:hypothetical protein
MIVTNTASGLTSLLTFMLMLTGSLQLWMLVCVGIVAAAAGAFHSGRGPPVAARQRNF